MSRPIVALMTVLWAAGSVAAEYSWIASSTFPSRSPTALDTCYLFAKNMAAVTAGDAYPWHILGVKLWDAEPYGTADGHIICCVAYERAGVIRDCVDTSVAFNVSVSREGDSCPQGSGWDSDIGGCVNKNTGPPHWCGLPHINLATGAPWLSESDEAGFPRLLSRNYVADKGGGRWRWQYEQKLSIAEVQVPGNPATHIVVSERADGRRVSFRGSIAAGFEATSEEKRMTLEVQTGESGTIETWRVHNASGETEIYDSKGNLVEMQDEHGRRLRLIPGEGARIAAIVDDRGAQWSLTYDPESRLEAIEDSAGRIWAYSHDEQGNLESVRFPDHTSDISGDNPRRQYLYGELEHTSGVPRPTYLTGIEDRRQVRVWTVQYDVEGALFSVYGAGNTQFRRVDTDSAGVRTITDGRSNSLRYESQLGVGVELPLHIEGPGCGACGG